MKWVARSHNFINRKSFEVGDVSKVFLWNDVWCTKVLLQTLFLNLFSISMNKEEVSFFGTDKYGVTLELEVLSDWFRSGK